MVTRIIAHSFNPRYPVWTANFSTVLWQHSFARLRFGMRHTLRLLFCFCILLFAALIVEAIASATVTTFVRPVGHFASAGCGAQWRRVVRCGAILWCLANWSRATTCGLLSFGPLRPGCSSQLSSQPSKRPFSLLSSAVGGDISRISKTSNCLAITGTTSGIPQLGIRHLPLCCFISQSLVPWFLFSPIRYSQFGKETTSYLAIWWHTKPGIQKTAFIITCDDFNSKQYILST